MELLAMTGAQIIMTRKLMYQTVIIYTDSQAALSALRAVEIRSKLILECKKCHERTSRPVDLARKTTRNILIGPGTTCTIIYVAVRTNVSGKSHRVLMRSLWTRRIQVHSRANFMDS